MLSFSENPRPAFAYRDADAEVKDQGEKAEEVFNNDPAPSYLPSEEVANQAIYYATRRFTQNSRLHQYLADKCPNVIYKTKKEYNLFEVLTALRRVIANEQLFDPQNPSVVLCDPLLEGALDVKALHVSEIRDQVCKQFHPKFPHSSVETQTATQTQTNFFNNEKNRLTTLADHNPIVSPLCVPFNVEGMYFVKPAFLMVLRSVEGVSKTQVVFPYREVANILYKYIMMKSDIFFDSRNVRIALVENDPLGEAFGVKAFARSQVTAFMRAQLTPFTQASQLQLHHDLNRCEEETQVADPCYFSIIYFRAVLIEYQMLDEFCLSLNCVK